MHSEHKLVSLCVRIIITLLYKCTTDFSIMSHCDIRICSSSWNLQRNSAESESLFYNWCWLLYFSDCSAIAVCEKWLATNLPLPKHPIKRVFITFWTGIKIHLALSYYATPETQLLYVNDKLVQSIIVSTLYTLAISIQSPLPRQHIYWIFFSQYPGRCIPKKYKQQGEC